MSEKSKILDIIEITQKLKRLAWQVYEKNSTEKEIIIVGISERGLIAAPTDQGLTEWGCSPFFIVTNSGIGSGFQNTNDIAAGCATPGIAADICANLTIGTYSDWFLPSKDELNKMYLNIGPGNALGLGNVGGFANVNYWSSTGVDYVNARNQNFSNGYQYYGSKSLNLNVRAVRAF